MCDHDAKQPIAVHVGKPSPIVGAAPSTGSRRQRLWDLPHKCHCPVVGVCFPLDTLRRLVNKALGGKAVADDYEVHVGAIAECIHRNRLSELMQHELERRYAREIKAYRLAKTTKAVADLWATAVCQGDVAGAFWAALTHPRCDDLLQEALCRDMHMLQHQAGATVRIDIAKFNALMNENAILSRELGRVQTRSTRLLSDKNGEIERLNAQLMQLRAEGVTKDSRLAFLVEDMAALKASIPGFDAGVRLQKKVDQMAARQSELEGQNTELRQKLASAAKSLDALGSDALNAVRTDVPERPEPHLSPVTVYLKQKTVLCVGGRSGNIAIYRDLVERVGGRFAHHDGGLEDSQSVLDSSLAAADLVICQTGCISHNAYWKVKDFCKRTGKRCVFVENPSASSLVRGLEQMSDHDTGAIQGNNVTLS
ncbi:MAG: DUF2325 domain-containing protein [Rhodoferax sp.]|nr:DUF2325 domain-containing protein [Rhodoferax sp.]